MSLFTAISSFLFRVVQDTHPAPQSREQLKKCQLLSADEKADWEHERIDAYTEDAKVIK